VNVSPFSIAGYTVNVDEQYSVQHSIRQRTETGLSCPNIGASHGRSAKRVGNSTSKVLVHDTHACRPLVWHEVHPTAAYGSAALLGVCGQGLCRPVFVSQLSDSIDLDVVVKSNRRVC